MNKNKENIIESQISTMLKSDLSMQLDGSVSIENGFFPCQDPEWKMPESHEKWNELCLKLPLHTKSFDFRWKVESLPILSAAPELLPAKQLQLAASMLGITAHLYWNFNGGQTKPSLPDSIVIPWLQVCKRLGRQTLSMTADDLHLQNQYLKSYNLSVEQKYKVENLNLNVSLQGTQPERVFFTIFSEICQEGRSIVKEVAAAQDAVVRNDPASLTQVIRKLIHTVNQMTSAFNKISLNPQSSNYFNPQVLARTSTSTVVPTPQVKSTISGIYAPFFVILDIFVGRKVQDTEISKEFLENFDQIPQIQQEFFKKCSKISVKDQVNKVNSRELTGLFQEVCEAQTGSTGFLGVHLDKVRGVITISSLIGRRETVAGFKFADPLRTIMQNLEQSRLERTVIKKSLNAICNAEPALSPLQKVEVKMERVVNSGPGSKFNVIIPNDESLVSSILLNLELKETFKIPLTSEWKEFQTKQIKDRDIQTMEAKLFLRFSDLESLNAKDAIDISKILKDKLASFNKTQSKQLEIINFDNLSVVLKPKQKRTYSLSQENNQLSDRVSFTVRKDGQVSSKLCSSNKMGIVVNHVQCIHFKPPKDEETTSVLIGIGSGIAPFRSFWKNKPSLQPMIAYFGFRKYNDHLYKAEFDQIPNFTPYIAQSQEHEQNQIQDLIKLNQNQIASLLKNNKCRIQVCGSFELVKSIIKFIEGIAKKFMNCDTLKRTEEQIQKLVADHILQWEVFASPTHAIHKQNGISDLFPQNEDEEGQRLVVDGTLQDINKYMHFHPGGVDLLKLFAGTDATKEFHSIHSHTRTAGPISELQNYSLGLFSTPEFKEPLGKSIFTMLYDSITQITREQNRINLDYRIPEELEQSYSAIYRTSAAHSRFIPFLEFIDNFMSSLYLMYENSCHMSFNSKIRDLINDIMTSMEDHKLNQEPFPFNTDKQENIIDLGYENDQIMSRLMKQLINNQQNDSQLLKQIKKSSLKCIRQFEMLGNSEAIHNINNTKLFEKIHEIIQHQ